MRKFLANLSVTQRIGAITLLGQVFVAVAIVMLVLGIVASSLQDQAVEAQKVNLRVFRDMLEVRGGGMPHIVDGKLAWGTYAVDDNHDVPDRLKSLMGIGASIFKGDTRVSTNVVTTQGKRGVGTKLADGIIKDTVLIKGQAWYGEADVIGTVYLVGYEPVKDDKGNVIGAMVAGMPRSTFFSLLDAIRWPVIGISATLSLLMCGVLLWVTRTQLAALPRLASAMAAITRGDYAAAIADRERSDEIGRMAQALGSFRDSLREADDQSRQRQAEQEARLTRSAQLDQATRGFAETIDAIVDGVSQAVGVLRGNAQGLSATADQTLSTAQSVAAASEQASSNVQAVASATEELSASIDEISRQVAEATSVASQAVTEASQTNQMMQSLSDTAARIGEVVGLINDIASQTNLLALNATIEAARAGDAGKGFAVVASEVKSLANQTAKATGDIQNQIAAIQNETTRAASAIDGICQTINTISGITQAVASAVTEQGAATSEIARSVLQASDGTNAVTRNTTDVTQAARRTGVAADELLGAAEALNNQSSTLRQQVDTFVAEIRAG